MKIVKSNHQGIELAVQYLRAGKAVVYPTDTSYGLGVDATNPVAVRRLYKIKQRSLRQPVHVIVDNFSAAKKFTMVSPLARRLAKKFWPGALTLVLPINRHATRSIKLLSAGTGTIGIRIPDNKLALALVRKLGKPITTPSANPARGPAPYSVAAAAAQFRGKKYQPDLCLDAGKLPKRAPSTIVKVIGNQITVLREGPVDVSLFLQKT